MSLGACPHVGCGRLTRERLHMTNTINKFALSVQRFLKSEDGPTAVEYAVMVALIIIFCLGSIQLLGDAIDARFTDVANTLDAATSNQ